MTLVLALLLLLPLGWHGPRLGQARIGGRRGLAAGGVGALILGFAICWALAQAMGALRGTDPRLEFEAALNAWKLLILFVPAVCLHLARKARG